MTEEEKPELREKICAGLKKSFENLLRRKTALRHDMVVFADLNGQPRVVPAVQALAEYEAKKAFEKVVDSKKREHREPKLLQTIDSETSGAELPEKETDQIPYTVSRLGCVQ